MCDVDRLLFYRQLQAQIAIELKIDSFKPEYKGKMEFYLNVLNDRALRKSCTLLDRRVKTHRRGVMLGMVG